MLFASRNLSKQSFAPINFELFHEWRPVNEKKDENAAGCALPAASASGEVAAHDQNNVTPSDFAVPLLSLG